MQPSTDDTQQARARARALWSIRTHTAASLGQLHQSSWGHRREKDGQEADRAGRGLPFPPRDPKDKPLPRSAPCAHMQPRVCADACVDGGRDEDHPATASSSMHDQGGNVQGPAWLSLVRGPTLNICATAKRYPVEKNGQPPDGRENWGRGGGKNKQLGNIDDGGRWGKRDTTGQCGHE